MLFLKRTESWIILLRIHVISVVILGHFEDSHRSDRNTYVLSIRHIQLNNFMSDHLLVCA